ncbi:MAG: YitT family protein [Clostridia bacterium]|nr:YitT family protein [Clostridia bacterium]
MKKIKSLIYTMIGTALTGFAVSAFLTPNKIVCGGVSGISTILYQTLNIAPGLTFAVINIAFLIVGIKFLGVNFTVKTLFGAGMLSLFVQLFSYFPTVTDNIFLAAFFGGTLYGLGIGIAFASGASTGGTDILSRLIQYFLPQFPIGKLLLLVDGLVIIASLIVFKDTELVLFGVFSLFFSTFCIDWLIRKLNVSKIAFVVTEKGREVSDYLVSTSPRGVTIIKAIGAYSSEKKRILFCALKENEVPNFQDKILSIDKDAFIVYSESQQIQGNGFYIYR